MEQAPDQTSPDTTMPPAADASVAESAKEGAAYGSIIGIVVIVAVLVAGAFYVWGERLETAEPMVPEDGVRGGDASPAGSMEGSAEVEVSEPQPI
ncbi:MAG TPA: hypothetical protein PK609_01395 [Candidatus Paceibacterota bacterium]|nr:hypothetical protein [Candidatus Paceibacterota bacterium]